MTVRTRLRMAPWLVASAWISRCGNMNTGSPSSVHGPLILTNLLISHKHFHFSLFSNLLFEYLLNKREKSAANENEWKGIKGG